MRNTLIQLNFNGDYPRAFEIIKHFQIEFPKTQIGFSSNVGDHGGFITDDDETIHLWKFWKEKVDAPSCRRCSSPMSVGKAISPAVIEGTEGTYSIGLWIGEPNLVGVWKCSQCGHSFEP